MKNGKSSTVLAIALLFATVAYAADQQPVAKEADADVSTKLEAGECTAVCPLPNLARR